MLISLVVVLFFVIYLIIILWIVGWIILNKQYGKEIDFIKFILFLRHYLKNKELHFGVFQLIKIYYE